MIFKLQDKLDKLEKKYEVLSDPNVQYHNPSAGGIFSLLMHNKNDKGLEKIKEELAELRTLKEMHEKDLDTDKDYSEYYKIKAEQEKILGLN